MNEDLHKYNGPFISADEGWKQMQQLLNEHLPVNKVIEKSRFTRYFIAASILLLVLVSLQLAESSSPITRIGIADISSQHPQGAKPFFAANSSAIDYKAVDVVASKSTNHFMLKIALAANEKENSFTSTVETIAVLERSTRAVDTFAQSIPGRLAQKPAIHFKAEKPGHLSPELSKKAKSPVKHSWELLAGLGVNKSLISAKENLQPYPVVQIKYNINSRFYISSRIAPYSLVKNNIGGVSKSIYINDTARNISMYNETTTYDRLHYLDIPLSAGLNITKHISVETGVQLSFLINKKTSKSVEPYDFSMNRVNEPTYASFMAAMPGGSTRYDVRPRHVDSRVLAGLNYNYQKFSVALTYQQGITPLLINGSINKGKNKILSLDLLLKLK